MVALAWLCWHSSIGAAPRDNCSQGLVAQLHFLSHDSPWASSAGLCTNIPPPCNNLQLGEREEDGLGNLILSVSGE